MFEFCPNVMRLQPQCVTDRQESEEPAGIIVEKPFPSLACAAGTPAIRFKWFMNAEKCVFEHGIHQGRLRAYGSEFDPTIEEVLPQGVVVKRRFIPGVAVCRNRFGSALMTRFAFGGVHG